MACPGRRAYRDGAALGSSASACGQGSVVNSRHGVSDGATAVSGEVSDGGQR